MPPKGKESAPKPAAGDKPSAAEMQQRQYNHSIAELELPKTTLTKLAKGSIPDNVKMQQDVVQALLRGSTLFINYLAAAAHDQALSRSGKQITAGDVIKAIAELDFGPADALVPILEQELAAFRNAQAAAKANKKAGAGRGRRRQSAPDAEGDTSMAQDGEGEEGEEGDGDEDDDDDGEEGGEGEEGEGEGEGEGEAGEGEDDDEGGDDEAGVENGL